MTAPPAPVSAAAHRGRPPRAKALLLDALGTLVELPPPAPALREELSERFGVDVPPDAAATALAAEIAFYRAHFDEARDRASLERLRRRCGEVLRDALPPLGELAGADLTEALLGALRFRAYPDAAPAITAARERGLRVVVASNWDVSLPDTLARVGLIPLLDGVVTSALVGERKPSPRLFARALAMAGVDDPAHAVHVGDSLREDVDGALGSGLRAILVERWAGAPPAAPGSPRVPVITSLAELGPLL